MTVITAPESAVILITEHQYFLPPAFASLKHQEVKTFTVLETHRVKIQITRLF